MLGGRKGIMGGEALEIVTDSRLESAAERRMDRDHVQHLLSRLGDRERRVLLAHYGLESDQTVPATYDQLSQRMGVSKQRLREIEQTALEKMRTVAGSG